MYSSDPWPVMTWPVEEGVALHLPWHVGANIELAENICDHSLRLSRTKKRVITQGERVAGEPVRSNRIDDARTARHRRVGTGAGPSQGRGRRDRVSAPGSNRCGSSASTRARPWSPRRRASCATGWPPITPTGCSRCGAPRTRQVDRLSLIVDPQVAEPGARSGRAAGRRRRCAGRRGRAGEPRRNRGRQGPSLGAARPALHLRELRRRQAQRAGPCRRPAGRRGLRQPGPYGAVQPALPLWRRRSRQDPSDARDRLACPHCTPRAAR